MTPYPASAGQHSRHYQKADDQVCDSHHSGITTASYSRKVPI
jgi:hypothetical protein